MGRTTGRGVVHYKWRISVILSRVVLKRWLVMSLARNGQFLELRQV